MSSDRLRVYSPLIRLGKHSLQDLADYLRAGKSGTAIARVYPGARVFDKKNGTIM
jgi:hypothetical protein